MTMLSNDRPGRPDPLELFAAMNPVPDAEALAERPGLDALLHEVAQAGAPLPRLAPTRRQRIRRVAVPALIAAVLAAAGFTWVLTRRASNPVSVTCYGAPSESADRVGLFHGGDDPVAACRQVWLDGRLVADRGHEPSTAPALAACVLRSGNVGVFPATGGDPCRLQGLPRLARTQAPSAAHVQRAIDDLRDRFGGPCIDGDDATAIVRAALDREGLRSWHVETSGTYSAARPCASLGLDTDRRTVLLVPIPRPPPGR